MNILKFGGSSVGTTDSILNVKRIVEAKEGQTVVVVSALSGVTDQLILLSQHAQQGESAYADSFNALKERHHQMILETVPAERQAATQKEIDQLFEDLRSILHGIQLIQDLTPKTADAVVAFGERLSSVIMAGILEDAQHVDARQLIKTIPAAPSVSAGHVNMLQASNLKHSVDFDTTNKAISDWFATNGSRTQRIVMGGFIASDTKTGAPTNLGRGGSDYTAAVVAAALNAESLEIWTDVNGFLTADPRVIPTAVTIPQLSYGEAMELCNFGAKVVYPPTIYPVCAKNIPIYIRNTHEPAHPGTIICKDAAESDRPIRGISSVNETTLVTVHGLSMVGVVGVNRRIFATLAEGGVSVFLVAQSSSETSTSLAVTPADAPRAKALLDAEFQQEIAEGSMSPALLSEGLATIAVVGQNMHRQPGIVGKLFSVLGRNGINLYTVALGDLEMNVSFVVERNLLRKALQVLHDSLFLSSYEELNIFLCGTGTVGGKLMEQITAQHNHLMRTRNLKINLVAAGGRTPGVDAMVADIYERNLPNSVFVDCTASADVAAHYQDLLEHNVSVVTANKIAASGPFESYLQLKRTARDRGVKFLFETNVGAGLPIINTINDLRASGDRIIGIEAVLSGTLNYVFNVLDENTPMSKAIMMAKENGYSEPDPRIDLSGTDVLRKITILARESGFRVETSDIERNLFLPQRLFDGTQEEFWKSLTQLDGEFEEKRQALAMSGKHWRFVAEWTADEENPDKGHGRIGLKEIVPGHPLYDLEGSNNIVCLRTERYREYPMLIQGYGAGAAVTAAGVFADILRVL